MVRSFDHYHWQSLSQWERLFCSISQENPGEEVVIFRGDAPKMTWPSRKLISFYFPISKHLLLFSTLHTFRQNVKTPTRAAGSPNFRPFLSGVLPIHNLRFWWNLILHHDRHHNLRLAVEP